MTQETSVQSEHHDRYLSRWRNRRQSQYLNSVLSVLQMTNCIVAGTPHITNSLVKHATNNAPAFSVGDKIFFSEDHVNSMYRRSRLRATGYTRNDFFLEIRGLNYHELCHVMFTPSPRSEFMKQFKRKLKNSHHSSVLRASMNILEDQRIEMRFVSMYSQSSPFFRSAVLHNLLTEGTDEKTYLLIAGRFYLPKKLRRAARKQFADSYGEAMANELDSIVKQYATVTYPYDLLRGMALIDRFKDLLLRVDNSDDVSENAGDAPQRRVVYVRTNCGHDQANEDGEGDYRGVPAKEQREAAKHIESHIIDDDEDDEDEFDGDIESSRGSGTSDESQDDQDDEEESDSEDSSSPEDDADGNDSEGSGASLDQQGEFTAAPNQDSLDSLRDLVKDEIEAIKDDDALKDELERLAEAVQRESMRQSELPAGSWAYDERPASETVRRLRHKLRTELAILKTDLEPSWLKNQTAGRVNVARFARRQPHELDVFDRWDEGAEEDSSCEVAVLIDCSGSMSGMMLAASEIAWAVKGSLSDNDIECTIAGFSTSWSVLHGPRDKVNPMMVQVYKSEASTDPLESLKALQRRLSTSSARNKLLLVITDGMWHSPDESDQVIVNMGESGIHTVLLGLQGAASKYGAHGCQIAEDITTIDEMASVVRNFVTAVMQQARQHLAL